MIHLYRQLHSWTQETPTSSSTNTTTLNPNKDTHKKYLMQIKSNQCKGKETNKERIALPKIISKTDDDEAWIEDAGRKKAK